MNISPELLRKAILEFNQDIELEFDAPVRPDKPLTYVTLGHDRRVAAKLSDYGMKHLHMLICDEAARSAEEAA